MRAAGRRYRCGCWCWLLLSLALPAAAAPQTLPAVPVQAAPIFTLADENGRSHRLTDYRGKVVVLNFWATWCPPCRAEMPSMERAWQQVRDQGIVIIGVNVGESADDVFEFTGRYPLSFPLLLDLDGKVVASYGVAGLPTTVVIDPAGNITHRATGSREWDHEDILRRLRALRPAAAERRP